MDYGHSSHQINYGGDALAGAGNNATGENGATYRGVLQHTSAIASSSTYSEYPKYGASEPSNAVDSGAIGGVSSSASANSASTGIPVPGSAAGGALAALVRGRGLTSGHESFSANYGAATSGSAVQFGQTSPPSVSPASYIPDSAPERYSSSASSSSGVIASTSNWNHQWASNISGAIPASVITAHARAHESPENVQQQQQQQQQQPEEFSDVLRMLEPQTEFSDLGGMFHSFQQE